MKIKDATITLQTLRFFGYHGLLEHEKVVGNTFEVTLVIHFPAKEVMTSGDLDCGINYAEVYGIIKEEMALPTELLESLAHRILCRVKAEFPLITEASLSITKLAPPIENFNGAGVTFTATAIYEA